MVRGNDRRSVQPPDTTLVVPSKPGLPGRVVDKNVPRRSVDVSTDPRTRQTSRGGETQPPSQDGSHTQPPVPVRRLCPWTAEVGVKGP